MLEHATALVHHPYLIVYVHAANHPFVSDIVIVASLLFAYVVQLLTVTSIVGALVSYTVLAFAFFVPFHNAS